MERSESVGGLAVVQDLLGELLAQTAGVMDELAAVEQRLRDHIRDSMLGLWETTDALQEELDALRCRVQVLERANVA
jgi:hypothetical protein